jgi:TolB-like protein/Tfp pilus assembly protein PilF
MTSKQTTSAGNPTADDIRTELDRMAVSEVFLSSPQLVAFLRYVVEATLEGKQDRIKAYTIGIEVLRRDVKFDPQLDPIVRVEATRLRRALERYYAGTGADDPIIIDLPRGTYVPTFRLREIPDESIVPFANSRQRFAATLRSRPIAASLVALLLIAFVVGIGIAVRFQTQSTNSVVTQRASNGLPIVVVQPFSVQGSPGPGAISAAVLSEKMRNGFARFDSINIISLSAPGSRSPSVEPRADYRFEGLINYLQDGETIVQVSLLDAKDGSVVWTRTFDRISPSQDSAATEESIVLSTAATLLQPFGVIHARERVKHLATGEGDPRYRCILEASESLRSFDPGQHARAQACLERLTVEFPSFAAGFRYLAAVTLRDYQFGPESRSTGAPILARALRAAQRAVELKPESARGYNTLASIYFANGEVPQAFAASDRAVALDVYDRTVLGDYGGRMISAGELDRGVALLRRAAGAGAMRPTSHHFYLFLSLYLKGEMAEAAYEASQLTSNNYPLGLVARALAAAQIGDRDKALQLLERLVVVQPAWRDNPRGQLEKLLSAGSIVERLERDLASAGLAATRDLAARPESATLPPGNGMPTIYIEPFRVTGTPPAKSVTATLLFAKINDAFSRFDTINVTVGSRQRTNALDGSSQPVMIAEPRADYRLSGALEYRDGQTSVLFRLVDAAEAKVVWSRMFERVPASGGGAAEDAIVGTLANALLQSYGVIRAHDRAKHLASGAGDPRYRCILEAADAVRSLDPGERERARECLERLTVIDPSFAVGYAFLAITYNREYQQGYGERARDPQTLEKALRAARRAIELQPEDSRAYLALFVVQYNRRELPSAFAAAEKAIALNSYDMLTLGEYGGRLILTGEIERGMALMQRAGEYGAIRPSWHYFYLFMGNYLRGDMKEAAKNADHITTDNYALGLVARAIAGATVKDGGRARQAIDRLLALSPVWRTDPAAELACAIPDPAIVERLMRDLTLAGLPARS